MFQIDSAQKIQLKQAATEVLKNPYPKDAATVYGAAVLTQTGKIYASAQYFSDTYSLTLHAEQAALAHAAAHAESAIVAIAITSTQPQGDLAYPCHMCKQLLWESRLRSGTPMQLIIFDQYQREELLDLDAIINYPWPAKK